MDSGCGSLGCVDVDEVCLLRFVVAPEQTASVCVFVQECVQLSAVIPAVLRIRMANKAGGDAASIVQS